MFICEDLLLSGVAYLISGHSLAAFQQAMRAELESTLGRTAVRKGRAVGIEDTDDDLVHDKVVDNDSSGSRRAFFRICL